MRMTFSAAGALAAAFIFCVPAFAAEGDTNGQVVSNTAAGAATSDQATENKASDQAVDSEANGQATESRTADQAGESNKASANAEPASQAEPAAEAKPAEPKQVVEDPFTTALKAQLAEAPHGLAHHDKTERAALAAFYEARQYQPLWVTPNGLSAKGKAVIKEIKAADDWGLRSSDFPLPNVAGNASEDQRAAAEVKLGVALLKYARYAKGGRFDPSAITKFLYRDPPLMQPSRVLEQIAAADQPDAYLRSLHPQHVQFKRLREKYLAMRQSSPAAHNLPRIPDGPKIAPGKRHAQVALVRERLELPTPADAESATFYDDALVKAVREFQRERGLRQADGVINAATRHALNANSETGSVRRILANMEEWRWMPENLGDFYVTVNIPEYTVRVVQNGRVVHSERVVVGKTDMQTPIFSHDMEQVIFHPFWGVPDSIKKNELQPGLINGGAILARNGLRVQYRGRDIDPDAVNWAGADMRNFHIYQPPGPTNVLGVVKFRFPNKHDVYMHDTPQKNLFTASARAFSHGCMRVQNPVRLAELLLAHDKNFSSDRVRAMAGPGGAPDNQINLTRKIPVHITYFTAWVDDDGHVRYFNDVYGHEERIALALEGKMNLISKVPEPRSPSRETLARSSRGSYDGTPRWMRDLFNF